MCELSSPITARENSDWEESYVEKCWRHELLPNFLLVPIQVVEQN